MTETQEIGEARQLEQYLLHFKGKPLEEARALKTIMETRKLNQNELSRLVPYNQQQISRLLSLLSLETEFQDLIEKKKLAWITALKLVRMPPEKRLELLKHERVTHKLADQARRELVSGLLDAVQYLENVDSPVAKAEAWFRALPDEEKVTLHSKYLLNEKRRE